MNFAADLRRDLAERAQKYAEAEGLPHLSWLRRTPDRLFCAIRPRFPAWELLAGKPQGDTGKSGVEKALDEGSHSSPMVPAHY
jgi:hypothetical protein